MRIYWGSDIGFGQPDIVKRSGNDGDDYNNLQKEELILTVDTERMDSEDDKAFIEKILSLLIEMLKVDG